MKGGCELKYMTDRLERIRIAGFGSLADVSFEPGPITVLIGANGSGKSNLLRVLRMVSAMLSGSLQRFMAEAGGASSCLYYGAKRTKQMVLDFDLVLGGQAYRYRAQLGFAAGDRLTFVGEVVVHRAGVEAVPVEISLGEGLWESGLESASAKHPAVEVVRDWLSQMTFFHFHDTSLASALRTMSSANDDRALRSDGSNLAAFLARLAQSQTEEDQAAWRRISLLVRRIAPSIKTLCPTPIQNGNNTVRLDWIDDQDERFGVHQLSDGTLRAIALITALAQPTHLLPRLISIDEPELGLHPAAIRILAELARSISRHTQILFATQSTAFLDHFGPEEVIVVERHEGASNLARLDLQTLRSWLEDYTLSEIFNKGVIGGRP